MWRLSPQDIRESDWQRLQRMSGPVKSLDIFISHTWKTGGLPKMLALLVSSGIYLACPDCIVMPFVLQAYVMGFEALCPLAPWMLIGACLGHVAGFLSAPYFPLACTGACHSGDICFVDIACIHQKDSQLKQRGIYGIGGFLKCAKELRVLWTPPYLSRMWCIFELAAYRKANPTGRISMAPIFIEHSVHLVAMALWGGVWGYWAIQASGLLVAYGYFLGLLLPLAVALLPVVGIVHGLRHFFCAKHQLFQDLRHFRLASAECSEEFDAIFVHTAIQSWYGSTEAFEQFVQKTLVQEIPQVIIPHEYCLLLSTVPITGALEETMSVALGGAPASAVLSSFVGHVFGVSLCWILVSLKLLYYLCDRFAMPYKPGLFNYVQTVAVYAAVCLFFLAGAVVGEVAYRHTLWTSCLFAIFSSVACAISYSQWLQHSIIRLLCWPAWCRKTFMLARP
ncbi:unnamed protein product [Symbiodinium natans]|uniref:Transmembrane protein n=1 Tax=Symbiodinium natans TaxID=878477 RepID=A0A812N057_9DINO|nr:unnamed protein product [Symbiodinium natans]